MYERFQIIVVVVLAVVWGLALLARRRPDVRWLRPLRDAFPRLSDQQRARARRRSDLFAGIGFILMGLAVPMVFGAFKLMFFSSFSTAEVAVVAAISVLCFVLGVAAIVQSRHR